MLEDFKDRVAVVTGGGEGIGRSLAIGLAAQGAKVGILDVNADAASDVVSLIRSQNGEARAFKCDVSILAEVNNAKDMLASHFGDADVIWANAGVGSMGGVLGMDQNNLDWIYDVNVRGILNTLRVFGSGAPVSKTPTYLGLMASVSGLTPLGQYAAAYGASKYAVVGIGEALLSETDGTNASVTICCPGLVNTTIWDAGKARPDRFGGETHLPDVVGERWRNNGMSPDWIAGSALATMRAGGGYVTPVDPHSLDDFNARNTRIESSFLYPDT